MRQQALEIPCKTGSGNVAKFAFDLERSTAAFDNAIMKTQCLSSFQKTSCRAISSALLLESIRVTIGERISNGYWLTPAKYREPAAGAGKIH